MIFAARSLSFEKALGMDPAQSASSKGDRLKVFISYSRADVAFSDELELALRDKGYEPLIDRHGIDAGEQWKARLGELILAGDSVVFVLTETAAASPICAWEVEEAARLAKRILVVTPGPVPANVTPPKELAGINWISCWANPAIPGSSLIRGILDLDAALRTDLGWTRQKTVLQEQAERWASRGQAADSPFLLRGDALTEALSWAKAAPKGAIVPDRLDAFLAASETHEARLKAEAQAGLAEREAALAQAAAAGKRVRNASLIGAALAGLMLLAALVAGFAAWQSQRRADILLSRVQLDTAALLVLRGNLLSARLIALNSLHTTKSPSHKKEALMVLRQILAREDTAAPQQFGEAISSNVASWDSPFGRVTAQVGEELPADVRLRRRASDGAILVFGRDVVPTLLGSPNFLLRPLDCIGLVARSFPDEHCSMVAADFRPESNEFLIADWGGTVRIFQEQIDDHNSLSPIFSPTRIFEVKANILDAIYDRKGTNILLSTTRGLEFIDAINGRKVSSISQHSKIIFERLDFNNTRQRTFAKSGTGTWQIFSISETNELHLEQQIFDARTAVMAVDGSAFAIIGKDDTLRVVSRSKISEFVLGDHDLPNRASVSVSHKGKMVAIGGADGSIAIWDTLTRQLLLALPAGYGPVVHLRFDGDALLAVYASGTIQVWAVHNAAMPDREIFATSCKRLGERADEPTPRNQVENSIAEAQRILGQRITTVCPKGVRGVTLF